MYVINPRYVNIVPWCVHVCNYPLAYTQLKPFLFVCVCVGSNPPPQTLKSQKQVLKEYSIIIIWKRVVVFFCFF